MAIPLQYSCLENPMEEEPGGLRVARSQKPLKQLSTALNHVFTGASAVKNPPADVGDLVLILGSGRSPGGGNGSPFQYSCLGNPMNRGT